ncbi:putative tnf receptor associated factor [Operophtera brumata]|uniref:Putative tnf receptor associated factor n=1 Tax=Operophtera brumata TaxID=104452 RepID=A0A0L7LTE3_OPEBR|nr:putative tnf receptor associated factor [Operophtera brumata]
MDAKIYPDPDSEKAIMGSVVYCIHHKEGCQWSDELRKLKEHSGNCGHEPIYCENKCGAKVQRRHTQQHIQQHCSKRLVPCRHCGQRYTQVRTCGHEPVYCENKCGAKVQRRHTQQHIQQHCSKRLVPCRHCGQRYTQRRHTQQHMQQHCSKRQVPCRHCGQRYTQDTVSAHGATCSRAPVPCPQRCSVAPLPRDELDTHLREHCAAAGVPCAFRDAGCRFKVG